MKVTITTVQGMKMTTRMKEEKMRITNYRKIEISPYVTALLSDNEISIQTTMNWTPQSISLSFEDFQMIVNVIQGKKLEKEIEKKMTDNGQLTAEHIRKAVQKLQNYDIDGNGLQQPREGYEDDDNTD
jgi:hypothetical protein